MSLRVAACFVVMVAANHSLAFGQTLPKVRLTAWEQAANGTGVVFKSSTPALVTEPKPLTDDTAEGLFEYAVDTSDLKWGDDCRCFRYYIVTVRSKRSGVVSRHKIKGIPSGAFEDQRVAVRLTITDEGSPPETDSEEIVVPVASAPGLEPSPLINARLHEPIGVARLAGESEVQIELHNPSKQMAMQVPSEIVIAADHNHLWKVPARLEGRPFPLTLLPNATETFRLKLEPRTWEAIQKSFLPSDADKAHTGFRIQVPYANPVFRQREGMTRLTVPIRFRPNLFSLVLALAAGVILGSMVPLFSRKSGSVRRWSRATATALSAAVVLELVGMFMVAYNSKFRVFSFELDPWQTLPVVLLGIGNGLLGLQAARRLKFIQDEA